MRPLIHHSSRLALPISRVPRISGFVSINYFQAVRLHTASAGCVDETFALPIGNNGEIKLRVTRPAVSHAHPQSRSSSGPNVILYLPPGPLFQGLGADPSQDNSASLESRRNSSLPDADSSVPSPQHLLASATSATVVTVNYRLGRPEGANALPENVNSEQEQASSSDRAVSAADSQTNFYQYPTPVHDTLGGFDWIQNHLKPARLAVFGSHIGGSLALMLALTEAQTVQAVAAHEPVCDWPGLDEYCAIEDSEPESSTDGNGQHGTNIRPPKKKTSRTSTPPDLIPLLQAREQFFASPERCFDAFASPILFLRSAGRDTPRAFPRYLTGPEYPIPTLENIRNSTSAEQHAAPDGSLWDRDIYPDVDTDQLEPTVPVVRRRKALSRWPPYGLDYGLSGKTWSGPGHGIGRLQVTLPWVRVFLQDGLGGSIDSETVRSTGHKNADAGHTVLARQGEEMVSVMRRACFWGREKGFGEKKVTISRIDGHADREAGIWLRSVFDGSIDED